MDTINEQEKFLLICFRLLTELEQMAVMLWIDNGDDSFIRSFNNERTHLFISVFTGDSDLFGANP